MHVNSCNATALIGKNTITFFSYSVPCLICEKQKCVKINKTILSKSIGIIYLDILFSTPANGQ